MQTLKKILSLLLVLAMMMGICAFAEEAADPTLPADDASITINGTVITGADINERYDYYINYYSSSYDVTDAGIKAAIRTIAGKSAIEDTLMALKADELDIQLTDEEKQAITDDYTQKWNESVLSVATSFGYSSELSDEENQDALASAAAYLEAYYGTDLANLIEVGLQNQRLTKLYNQITADVTVDASEVEAYYMEQAQLEEEQLAGNAFSYELYQMYGYSFYYIPEGYRGIKQILLSVDDTLLQDYLTKKEALENGTEGTTQEDVDAARAAVIASVQEVLDDIYTSFNNGTATFDELIDKYNIDPGMTSEPTRSEGYAVHQDSIMWDPAFKNAAMSIESVGGIAEPAIGDYGIYICYYLRDIPGGIQEMTEEDRAEIETALRKSKVNEAFSAVIDQWLAESEVVYSEAYNTYVGNN